MRGNAGATLLILDDLSDPVVVVRPVSENDGALGKIVQKQIGHGGVVSLAGRELELHRQAIADHSGVELGGQSSTTSTDTSVSNLFFWAAAC